MNKGDRQSGFSLVELSVVLVIVGLLLGGVIASTATYVQLSRTRDADRELALIKESLIGFALENGRLPCADTDGDGIENSPCPNCGDTIPYAQLGVSQRDPWGGAYLYCVTASFADDPVPPARSSFDLTGTAGNIGDIDIVTGNVTGTTANVATGMAVVVVSEGPNRNETLYSSDNERENSDTDRTFLENNFSNVDNPSEFDDRLIWISPMVLKAKMLEAGKLP